MKMLRAITLSLLVCASAMGQVIYSPILQEGDPVPGFEGDTIGRSGGRNPFLHAVVDSDGSVLFRLQHTVSNQWHSLYRFEPVAGEVSQLVEARSAIPGLPGAEIQSPSRFDTMFDGSAVISSLVTPGEDGSRVALLRVHGGEVSLLAAGGTPVPGHGVPFKNFNSSPFIEVDGNARGDVTLKARFNIGGDDQHGVYRGGEGRELERIIDTTQPVPGHAGASWDFGTNWLAPFEIGSTPITRGGDVYVRSWFKEAGEHEMLLLRSRPDGSLETLVDSTAGVPTPGRVDGAPMRGIVQLAQSGGDSVLLTSSTSSVGYSGSNAGATDVLISSPDGAMSPIYSTESSVPGRPDLTVSPGGQLGAAINLRDEVAVSSHVQHADGSFGITMLFFDADVNGTFVADGNDLPGLHPDAHTGGFSSVDINEGGDLVFDARIQNEFGGHALYHWTRDTGELQLVLGVGMEIDGGTVLDYQLAPSLPLTAADRMLSDTNMLTASVLLEDPIFGGEAWTLMHIQVPGPGSLAVLGCGLVASAGGRRRGTRLNARA
jgi:hypothetical protein